MLIWFAIYFGFFFVSPTLYLIYFWLFIISHSEYGFQKGHCHLVADWELFPLSSPAPAARLTLIQISSGSAVLQGEGLHPLWTCFLSWSESKENTFTRFLSPLSSLLSLCPLSRVGHIFSLSLQSFCFLPGCTHRLSMAPQGIALLLPQLQSVHISLN